MISTDAAVASMRYRATHVLARALCSVFRPMQALVSAPSLVFLAALTAMLFRPSDVKFFAIDRVAFVLLCAVVLLRVLLLRESIHFCGTVTWPLILLLAMAGFELLTQPYDPEACSVFAAKWLVPFFLFVLAGHVFSDITSLRRLETFSLVILAYLSFVAIAFMFGAKDLIFPSYILDESIGLHADRARGPFLQAVANGVSLNLLALIALDAFRRRRLRSIAALILLLAVPLAALATKTRAVWLSFVLSLAGLIVLYPFARVRRLCATLLVLGGVGLLCAACGNGMKDFSDRLQERSPVEFRAAMYEAGWDMFRERPFTGWGRSKMQTELYRRINDFHQEAFYFHNTALEVLVQYGLVGLCLYAWLILDLFRVGRLRNHLAAPPDGNFLDRQFRFMWPLLVVAYLLNAMFVVMNYQFVNGFLFTIAGILGAQNPRPNRKSRLLPT